MEGLISYIIKSSSILLVLYGYYWLFLRKQTFFTINRFYLLVSLFMGMILPFISIEIVNPTLIAGKFHPGIYIEHLFNETSTQITAPTPQRSPQELFFAFLPVIYVAGVVFFLIRYLVALSQLIALIRRNPQRSVQGIHIIKLKEQQPLFSFFNYLFVYQLPDSKEDRRRMFEHEKKHILQAHSVDLFITELACITNWFNPLVWSFKHAILENHEYIADRQVIRKYHTGGYPELLIKQTFKGCFSFTNYFACSKLKKRIMMMTKKQTSKFQVIRYIPAFLLGGILFYGICCNIPAKAETFITPELSPKAQTQTEKDTSNLSTAVDESPQFPELNGNVHKWILKKLKYPEKAMKEGKTGKVFVNFIIEEDGSISNPRIIKSISPEIDAEVIRVIKTMPKWKPGLQRGKPVRVSYNMAFTFLLSDGNGTPAKLKAPDKVTTVSLPQNK